MIDIRPDHLAIIRDLLARYAPGCEVRVFGSRVAGTAKSHSDLDLAVMDTRKAGGEGIDRLRVAFEESDLPFRVDVLDWNGISPEFRMIIEQKYEVMQEGDGKDRDMPADTNTHSKSVERNPCVSFPPSGERWPKAGKGAAFATEIDSNLV